MVQVQELKTGVRFKVANHELEDEHRITIGVSGHHILVDNLSMGDSATLDAFSSDVEVEIEEALIEQNWTQLIVELIEFGYLD